MPIPQQQGKPEDRIAEKLMQMAVIVQEMALIYEAGGEEKMNGAQPPNMQKVIPMSLDEWPSMLRHVANEWRQIGFEREQMKHLASSKDGTVVVRSALKES